ncbi:vWA domain-containing protein [Hyalangium gracile]|uniref:vWA domain-containing protein n=1 Tax=Hyalangium gracile TaxID=394092 RepID=UPI001CCD4E6A|nr:VWA domain-containing protein [Hyalangium gracile]
MGRAEIHRGSSFLLLATLLLSGLALAEEPVVPDWAEGWKETWLDAYRDGSIRMSSKVTPRFLGNGRQELFAVLELRSLSFPPGEPPAASVALVIDRSASTAGRRLLIARKAALSVIDGMTEKDQLAIIRVSDEPEVLPIEPLTAEHRARMKALVSEMEAVGRSDLSAGLEAAFAQLSKPSEAGLYRQVILLSDGRPTDGMVDQDGLARLARAAREQHSIHVNTVAIGEDADLDLMAGMAKQGWGFAASLNDSAATTRVSTRRQLDLVRRAASAVELRVRVGPTVTLLGVMGLDAAVQGSLARVPVGEVGSGEVIRLVLHLSTDNVGKEVRPIELAQIDLQYEDALTEKRRTQSLSVKAELNPAKARGRGALDPEALKHASVAFVQRHTARADETAEDGDRAGAREILESTRESLKQMARLARLQITDAMALLARRSSEIAEQSRPKAKPDPSASKKSPKKKP